MITILSTIFVLGVLIFVHELGHFIMAKRAGIRVDKFSLGFPPFLFKRRIGETEYCVGVIPLGGFVKMAGENPDEEAKGEPYEFMSKPVRTRAGVIFAGPFTNFAVAFMVLWAIYFVNGIDVPFDGVVIGEVASDSPAEEAGLAVDDIVRSINGTPVENFNDMRILIAREVEKPVTIVWERAGQEMSATVTTYAELDYGNGGQKELQGKIGIRQKYYHRDLNLINSASMSFQRVIQFVRDILSFVWDLITFKISAKMIGGPVFIAKMAGETAAQYGFSALLVFMAFLSVNLAILNVMPIPMLDGGHLLFLLVEKIKGSPMTVQQRVIAQQIGLVFLLLLIVFVTYNDIARFISG